VEPSLREAFNHVYSDALYADYTKRLEARVGSPPFRLAETPFFAPRALAARLEKHTREILALLSDPARIAEMQRAVPPQFDVPRQDTLPNCAQVDFAIVRGDDGQLDGRVVELQGFPSLYAFEVEQAAAWNDTLRDKPGFGEELLPFFGDLNRERAIARLRTVVCAGEDPETVVLLDLEPHAQKTLPDFVATAKLIGVEAVCATSLVREGRRLLRQKNGRTIPVRRIYNRIVFDELAAKKSALPFDYTEDLDVTWCPHPNWYWIWSKYSLPHITHPAIPQATVVAKLDEIPRELGRYVLKPLFSFAGGGVKIDVTREDLDRIPEGERGSWLLQRKIEYARELVTTEGAKVAVEVRVMCLRAPNEVALQPSWNLVRLSRGKMHGVDHNKDLSWVGSTVGLFAR
jgi:hypothetical protein